MKHCGILVLFFMLLNISLWGQVPLQPAGEGTEQSPYQIATWQNLYWIAASDDEVSNPNRAARWSSHYEQTAHIDLGAADPAVNTWDDGKGWTPIGNETKFSGFYDGDGFTIKNLYINRPAENNIGLFGHFGHIDAENEGSSTIRRVHLISPDVKGGRGVGTLVGRVTGNANTLIELCSAVNGSVVGDAATGGLVGSNNSWRETPGGTDNPIISKSYADISVSLSENTEADNQKFGGLVGCNQKGNTINSYALGTVTANHDTAVRIGGLAGCTDLRGKIENSYSIGQVNATDSNLVGGLVGTLSGQGANVGVVERSYWNTQTSGQPTSAGGIGKTTADMTSPYVDTYVNWDFDSIWADDEAYNVNNGYPYLREIDIQDEETPPLPVELSSFTAQVTADMAVNLQWRAETEINLLGYNVYRSLANSVMDAYRINPELIGAHNTSYAVSYSFLDEDVESGQLYYYWLQATDLDLTFSFHGPVSILVEYQEEGSIYPGVVVTELIGAYPNPFNPATSIRFSVAEPTEVTITVYNLLGQKMQTLMKDQLYNKGFHSVLWDGKESNGRQAASGIYFYKMETNKDYGMIKKMMLVK